MIENNRRYLCADHLVQANDRMLNRGVITMEKHLEFHGMLSSMTGQLANPLFLAWDTATILAPYALMNSLGHSVHFCDTLNLDYGIWASLFSCFVMNSEMFVDMPVHAGLMAPVILKPRPPGTVDFHLPPPGDWCFKAPPEKPYGQIQKGFATSVAAQKTVDKLIVAVSYAQTITAAAASEIVAELYRESQTQGREKRWEKDYERYNMDDLINEAASWSATDKGSTYWSDLRVAVQDKQIG